MRRFAAVSVGLHLVAVLLGVLWWWRAPRVPDEAPATIQLLFGRNADQAGAPVPPAAAAATAEPTPADGAAGSAAAAGPAAPPVRLGEGEVGLRMERDPTDHVIEAQADPGNDAPKYPPAAFRTGQQGTVVIRLHVATDGHVADAEILVSSGHPVLDQAAREALAKWRFIPALRDGVAVPSYRDQPTNFVLEN